MVGRTTSGETVPRQWAFNRFGVRYSELLEKQQRDNEALVARYREALETWLAFWQHHQAGHWKKADEEFGPKAAELSERVLS